MSNLGTAANHRQNYIQTMNQANRRYNGPPNGNLSFSMDGQDAHGSRLSMLGSGVFGPVYGNNNIGQSPDNWGQHAINNNMVGTFGSANPAIQQWNRRNGQRSNPNNILGGQQPHANANNGGLLIGNAGQPPLPPSGRIGGGGRPTGNGQLTSSFSGTGGGRTITGHTNPGAGYSLRGQSGQQQYRTNPITGQQEPVNTGGIYQGGTSNRRAGLAENGMVGSPDLGTVSELLRWASQVPGGEAQLRAMGMMPQVHSTQYGGRTPHPFQQDAQMQNQFRNQVASGQRAYVNGRLIDTSTGQPINGATYGNFTSPGYENYNQQRQGSFGGFGMGNLTANQNTGGANLGNMSFGRLIGGNGQQGDQSGFEMNLQNSIQQMLQNPTGFTDAQQTQMRTRAGDAAAGQQAMNAQRIQEDAVRRGAYGSAGGDADIRDQLNRSNMEGAASQQRAVQDVDFGLADLARQGSQVATGQGIGLLGEQFKNQNSIRELVMMLEALKSSMGSQGGLSMILGGA